MWIAFAARSISRAPRWRWEKGLGAWSVRHIPAPFAAHRAGRHDGARRMVQAGPLSCRLRLRSRSRAWLRSRASRIDESGSTMAFGGVREPTASIQAQASQTPRKVTSTRWARTERGSRLVLRTTKARSGRQVTVPQLLQVKWG